MDTTGSDDGGIPRATPAAMSASDDDDGGDGGGEIPLIGSWRRVRPLSTPLRGGQGMYYFARSKLKRLSIYDLFSYLKALKSPLKIIFL